EATGNFSCSRGLFPAVGCVMRRELSEKPMFEEIEFKNQAKAASRELNASLPLGPEEAGRSWSSHLRVGIRPRLFPDGLQRAASRSPSQFRFPSLSWSQTGKRAAGGSRGKFPARRPRQRSDRSHCSP